jgi:hypothetical protein
MARQEDSGLLYHGYRRGHADQFIEVESQHGEVIGVLHHLVRHSPSGMNWGYAGAGPCDAALSLLLDALGADAVCPVCRGGKRVVYVPDGSSYRAEPLDPAIHGSARRDWPCRCWEGYVDVPYGDFVGEFVADWGDEWRISRKEILAWLEVKTRTRRNNMEHG